MRVLIVSDNDSLLRRLEEALSGRNCQIDIAENMDDAIYFINIREYELILTVWKFQRSANDTDNKDIISALRDKFPRIPLIVISNSAKHEILAFNSRADDYISDDFSYEILNARINARIRIWNDDHIEIEDIKILPNEEKVMYKGRELEIKGKPFEVLSYLATQRNNVVSKDKLLNAIWNEPELVTPNVIEVAINQIRQKIDKPLGIYTIETIRRRGYRFCYPNKN